MTIAARLFEERNRLGMSQTEFAQLGGVGKTTQINYEKGERFPDAAFLASVASAGVDVLYVVTGKRGSSSELTAEENTLLTRLRQGSTVLRGYLQEVATLTQASRHQVTIAGDVGQSVAGDQTNSGPISFSVGSSSKKGR